MTSVYTSDLIETQTYQLVYVLGNGLSVANRTTNGPIQDININVPFKVRKIVFKPLSIYIAESAGNPEPLPNPDGNGLLGTGAAPYDSPNLLFCNLYDVNKAIGYTGYYSMNPNIVDGVSTGFYTQPVHDVTFSVRNLMNINGSYKFYLYNSATQSYYTVSPWSGIITITVEYHGQ